ncbi:MAG: hypothetical protein ACTSVV_15755 [Promethearchaeota archaeon]
MLNINEIIRIYNQINSSLLDGSALREDLFLKDIIFKFFRNMYLNQYPKEPFPDSRALIPNKFFHFTKIKLADWRRIKKKLNKILNLKKRFLINSKEDPLFVLKVVYSHLIETLYCLERSIFWFFNYKYNITETFEIAGMQALYYSSFFIKIAIQKFFGISELHFKDIGKIMVKINWSDANVEILPNKSWSAEHKNIANNFLKLMNDVDLNNFPEIYYLFQFKDDFFERITGISSKEISLAHSDYLRKARMNYVYDYTTRKSDPFNSFYGVISDYFINVQKYCFLDGTDRYNDGSEYYATHIEPNIYGSWGINEHFIGCLMKYLIMNLKKINNLKKYLLILSEKIENSKDFHKVAKEIILNWLKS